MTTQEAPVLPDPTPAGEPNRPHVVCHRCGMSRPRSADPGAPGWCHVCAPDPATPARQAGQVRERVREALRAAQDTIAAPDREHVWLPIKGVAHLFAMDATTSYCDRVEIARPARPWEDQPARRGLRVCRACEAAYRDAGWSGETL